MQNAGLDELQAGSKITRRNINNLRYAGDITLMAENEEELNSLLMSVKEESEKAGLKLNIQKTKVIASCPITSAQIFSGSKITEDGDCSHDDKPKQHVKKQRHHFADKGPYIQSYGFSSSHVQIWELNHKEGWALKNWGCNVESKVPNLKNFLLNISEFFFQGVSIV